MKILITGAAGFIGSHLAESLKSDGHRIRCTFLKGEDTSFLKQLGCELEEADLKDVSSLEKAVQGMDAVYHLAALSRYDAKVPDEEYYAVNAEGTRHLLELGRVYGVKQFVYISSIEALGLSQDGKPLVETSPSHPRNIYGKTKYEGELACREYFKKYNMDVRIVRPPTTYGPREYLILQRIFKPVSRGFFVVFGSGDALVEFCYIKNQVEGIKLAAQNGRPGETYIISDAVPYRFKDVIFEMAGQMDKKIILLRLPYALSWLVAVAFESLSRVLKFYPFYVKQTGRPPFSRATLQWAAKSAIFCDISKAKNELGYRPKYALAEGLKETIEWYRKEGLL
jgi:nucleoside-diphosphate-sugar epimerase